MTVFYTASYYGKEKFQKYYDLVLEAIEKCGVEVVSPEKGNYLDMVSGAEKKRLKDDRAIHYEAIRRGIEAADAVVMEISNEDFQLGHEATLAIQNKKHVLCLSLTEDVSLRVRHRYLHGAKYNEDSVWWVIEEFVRKIRGEAKAERFNMFLSVNQAAYLGAAASKMGLTKSEYIRRLVDAERGSK